MFQKDYKEDLNGMAPERAELYKLCDREGVGITVMKGYGAAGCFLQKILLLEWL